MRLTIDGTDDTHSGGHEWGAESPAYCDACGWGGFVSDTEAAARTVPQT